MKPIGLFYGSSTGNCETVAVMIKKKLHNYYVELHDILETDPSKVAEFDNIIFGVSTWGVGEFQEDWNEFIEHLSKTHLKDKVVALYGLGDQDTYADSFCDGLGVLHDVVKPLGCKLIGQWPTKGYDFNASRAVIDNYFVGLALDEDTQPQMTQDRVNKWLDSIITEFV